MTVEKYNTIPMKVTVKICNASIIQTGRNLDTVTGIISNNRHRGSTICFVREQP